jgi:Uma2 family endonuclease
MEFGGAAVHPLTFEDVLAMDAAGLLPEGHRFELEDGVLLDVTPSSPEHSGAVAWINRHIVGARSAWDVRVQDTLLIDGGFLSPDLVLFEPLPRTELPHSARLAVEVAKTSHARDRHKVGLYAKALVHEYWIVDLAAEDVVVHRGCTGEGYTDIRTYRRGEAIDAPEGIPPVDVSQLLG